MRRLRPELGSCATGKKRVGVTLYSIGAQKIENKKKRQIKLAELGEVRDTTFLAGNRKCYGSVGPRQ
jgi:hypothetical protein